MARTGTHALLLLLLAVSLPDGARAVCGDGSVAPGEQCDDGGTASGDGCAADCRFETQCLVARTGGDPSDLAVLRVLPNGALDTLATLAVGDGSGSNFLVETARCGRFLYLDAQAAGVEVVTGFEVGLDGSLVGVPGVPPASNAGARGLYCHEGVDHLLLLDSGVPVGGVLRSFEVPADGDLVQRDALNLPDPASPFFFGLLSGEMAAPGAGGALYLARLFSGPFGTRDASLSLLSVGPSGSLALADDAANFVTPLFQAPLGSPQIAFTADAGRFLMSGADAPNGVSYWNAPGGSLPLLSARAECCSLASRFALPAEAPAYFYFQSFAPDELRAAEFSGGSVVVHGAIPAQHFSNGLLSAFGGRVLLSLGPGEVASYRVAEDRVTLSPGDVEPTGTGPLLAGELFACPEAGGLAVDAAAHPARVSLALLVLLAGVLALRARRPPRAARSGGRRGPAGRRGR